MRAALIDEIGGKPHFHNDAPFPGAGSGETAVTVRASAVNPIDQHVVVEIGAR